MAFLARQSQTICKLTLPKQNSSFYVSTTCNIILNVVLIVQYTVVFEISSTDAMLSI